MSIDLTGRVAIVTGAGRGLGRAHALALAERGAKVVVNDLADAGGNLAGANTVVADIEAAGGEAVPNGANVSDMQQVEAMVSDAIKAWGRVDILVNNAGILRDKTFAKMSLDDFRLVIDVHLMGSVNCTKAVWDIMRDQQYGRVIFTSSSSGLYGNFGQSNYGAAKMAVVGFMNTLHLEGAKHDIRVNCLAPIAGTAMTEGLMPDAVYKLMAPESVSHGVVFLASDDAPSRAILCAGGGCFAVNLSFETEGVSLLPDSLSADGVAAAWKAIRDTDGMRELNVGSDQTIKFAHKAAATLGIDVENQ